MRKINNQKGFTLLETIVAVYILSTVVVAGFTAAFVSISSSIHAKNQVTAFYLAQDVFDYIRHQRDINVVDPDTGNWLEGLGSCVGINSYCSIDTSTNFISTINEEGGGPLYLTNGGIFTHSDSGNSPTNFRRVININEIASGQEATIEITVSWTQGANERSFRSVSSIFNSIIR